MALYNKSDMFYKDYVWGITPQKGDPKVSGVPGKTLFDRQDGTEVLYMINHIAPLWQLTKIDCLKMEVMIRQHLPSNVMSQKNVMIWLTLNWERYTLKNIQPKF